MLSLAAAIMLGGCASGPAWKDQSFAFSLPPDPKPAAMGTNVCVVGRVSIAPAFQSRSFTYRTAEDVYERDPYAAFIAPPERALAEPIRAWLRQEGTVGEVVDPGSGMAPTLVVEASVTELCGDFSETNRAAGKMAIHFIFYEPKPDGQNHVVLDRVCARQSPLTRRAPAALMAAWDTDLREIMKEISAEYAHTGSTAR